MLELADHQEKAIRKLKNGSILAGDVGTGKSRTAVGYYERNEAPRDVVVITTAKKRNSRDWVGEFAAIGVSDEPGLTVAGTLTVDSWNNIGKFRDHRECFFIFDEQRLVGTGQWTEAFLRIAQHNRWILLSATPGDNWLDYIPVFLAHRFYKNRTEFKRHHVVYSSWAKFPKVERYLGTAKLNILRQSILVDMPYPRHTTRHFTDVECDYDRDLFEKVLKHRWNVYENQPIKDVAELFRVMRKVVNSDRSRLSILTDLLVTRPKVIVFYNFDYELELLRTLGQTQQPVSTTSSPASSIWTPSSSGSSVSAATGRSPKNGWTLEKQRAVGTSSISTTTSGSGVPIAEWNGRRHQEIPQTDQWVYLVQYVAGAEGWNCIETDAMVFYSQTYSYKNYAQAQGRIDRLNTPYSDLWYYNLLSDSMIDIAIRKSLNSKKTFNERAFLKALVDITE